MKTVRFLAVALVLVVGANLTVAEDKKEIDKTKLIGKWEPTGAKKVGTIIELMKDGKLAINQPSSPAGGAGKTDRMEGTWEFADGKLKVKFKGLDGTEIDHSLTVKSVTDDKMVTVDKNDKEEDFKRVK